jgi:hypothetical protein
MELERSEARKSEPKKTGEAGKEANWEIIYCCPNRDFQFRSGREQDPGPRGSPQEPQAPVDDEADEPLFVLTANTESCAASLLLWHLGHSAFCLPYTRASNW